MKVSVVGVGYVGLVSGACLADVGNHVTCIDIDEKKITDLSEGKVPIHEPVWKKLLRPTVLQRGWTLPPVFNKVFVEQK